MLLTKLTWINLSLMNYFDVVVKAVSPSSSMFTDRTLKCFSFFMGNFLVPSKTTKERTFEFTIWTLICVTFMDCTYVCFNVNTVLLFSFIVTFRTLRHFV